MKISFTLKTLQTLYKILELIKKRLRVNIIDNNRFIYNNENNISYRLKIISKVFIEAYKVKIKISNTSFKKKKKNLILKNYV